MSASPTPLVDGGQASGGLPDRMAAPPRPASRRFILLYALGYTGFWLTLLPPGLIGLALRLRQLSPASATQDLALVLSVGAIFAIVSNPVFGHLSDRTRSRFGRRRPWLVGGMLCGSAALLIIALARDVTTVLVGWCLAQLAFNAVLSALVAVLPDQIPDAQRGTVSGVIAVSLPLGQALGTLLVRGVSDSTLLTFLLPAALGTGVVLLLAWMLPDADVRPRSPEPGVDAPASTFWQDLWGNPDFAWACLSRFLIATGSAAIATFQPYFLIEHLGIGSGDVAGRISEAVTIQTVLMVAFGLLSGKLSDVAGRRKIFVIAGGVLYGGGLCLIAFAGSFGAFAVAMAIMGIGHGMYFGTDLALVTGVLRKRPHASGRDLGLLNVANTLPQSFTPALGALLLQTSHGNYPLLFLVAGGVALMSSLAILPLRSSR